MGSNLRVRNFGHHAKCGTCVRHRLIIKRLGSNARARMMQCKQYSAHLCRQYKDRACYWSSRSLSRQQATSTNVGGALEHACLIIDSMDQSKHAFPRTQNMQSKEFQKMIRPRLSSTTVICHGHTVTTALSVPGLPSNSSKSVELIANTLCKLSASYDLRTANIDCQGDNCSKELKNITTLRYGSMLTALHMIRGFSLNFLSSGHSHEDVDHLFSMQSAWSNRNPELHHPVAFQTCLNEFYARKETRPHESKKEAIILHQVREWLLVLAWFEVCNVMCCDMFVFS